ncbi:putative phloem protein [Helianthus annuus]|nr:putative phloem protein [Helianthus annuus]
MKHEGIKKVLEVQQVLKSNLDEQVPQLSTNCEPTYKRSIDYEDGKFALSEVNGKRHLMLSAKAARYNFSNVKLFTIKPSSQSRFQEVIELLPQQVFRISCTIKSQTLSQDTEYVCYLVFKLSETCQGLHYPVKVRDLLQQENKEAEIIYFTSPSSWNIHDITRVPQQREDGCMEVYVWKYNSNHQLKSDCLLVNLKFTSYEGTMSGLTVYGLEFRPL